MEQDKPRRGRPRKGEIRPPKVKAEPRYGKGKERPQMWLIGEDAGSFKHSMYHPWQMCKAQSNYRCEEWTLTFEDFYLLWKDHWPNRGRQSENMCMTRLDLEAGWHAGNVIVITRGEQLKRQNQYNRQLKGGEVKAPKFIPKKRVKSQPVYKKMRTDK